MVKKVRRLTRDESVNLFFSKIPLGQEDKNEFFGLDKLQALHEVTLERFPGLTNLPKLPRQFSE